MEIGLGLDANLRLSWDEQAQLSREAAELGYTSVWTPEGAGEDSFLVCSWRWQASRDVVPEGLTTGIAVSPVATRTPFGLAMSAGTVSKLNSQLGERVVGTAMMTGTEVMTISDLNEMEARVDIGEVDVVLIAPGQTARLEVDAFRDQKFTGTVTEIANSSKTAGSVGAAASSQEATKFEVKIRIAEKEVFRPGMSVTAEVETRYRTNVLTVPIQSVTTRLPKAGKACGKEGGGGKGGCSNSVLVADSSPSTPNKSAASDVSKSGKAEKKGEAPKPIEVMFAVDGDHVVAVPIKRGISDDSYMEITEGADEGREVVSGGYKAINRDLEDGKRIKKGPAKADGGKEKSRS